MDKGYGTLYLVATPIGNLEDITYRAVRILSEADLVAAEDTRRTLKLLNHLQIKKPLISYHDNNRLSRADELVERLKNGENIALVSDAGMPAISDPGEELVSICIQEGIPVTVIPGCTAALSALVVSGLSTKRFAFEGFLPHRRNERIKRLKELSGEERTLIFYEAPHRIRSTLNDMLEVFGERQCALARELTKLHEEVLRGSLPELVSKLETEPPRGEFVIIVSGAVGGQKKEPFLMTQTGVEELVHHYQEQGLSRMEAMKQAAKDLGISKRDVYRSLNQ
ncbi:MAG TPA: 16S rRNA (cytidine(1402)-2'-O)-methyltransferase [Thermoclostridium sp.]|nr:16S rRNA (cytidine(1402)-2'-O)-methyltransferase [Clostridiaceae bacterium]HOQ75481.1 16S rRNA (cytidine(1402)-2'-O)-methyltransferase [Thermoclostridium sp.]HPU45728.1 16S rRNA (cytidine(1402)-2'-O)-methyltransferase [Thermoclostridium sp.]